MPPGTSDVPLTVFQTIPIDGMVFVLTPQDLAALIVKKAMNMARDLHVPLLGVVENMAWIACPHCGERIELFGAEPGRPGRARVRDPGARSPAGRAVDLGALGRRAGRGAELPGDHGARRGVRTRDRERYAELDDGAVIRRSSEKPSTSVGI